MADLHTSYSGPGNSPGFLLWRTSCQWQSAQREALTPLGVTHAQFVILASSLWLSVEKPPTQKELSDFTGIDTMTTSQVCRTLVAKGLITREPSGTDRRSYLLKPTSEGRAVANAAVAVVERVDKKFFRTIGSGLPIFTRELNKLSNLDR